LHPDHFSGLATLIVQMKMEKRTSPLEIFVHETLIGVVKNFLINSYLLPGRLGFEIRFKAFDENETFKISDVLEVLPRKNSHLKKLEKYEQNEKLSLYSGSFLFKVRDKFLMYSGDLGSANDLLLFKDFKIDILINEITHITFNELLTKIEQLNPVAIYLTHISDEDLPELLNSVQLLQQELKGKIFLAEDRFSFEM
jgi:ribonuclease BN (tRNA processing enzyme)